MKLKTLILTTLVLGAMPGAHAGLITLDFDTGAASGTGYTEHSISLDPTFECGTSYLCTDSDFSISDINGDLFELNAIDIAYSGYTSLSFEGHQQNGNTLTDSINVSGSSISRQFIGWTDLLSVDVILGDVADNAQAFLQIDSIQISRIPEPTSLALIGAGLLGLGARKLTRRKNIA